MSVITLLVVLMVLWQKVMRPMVEGYREAKPRAPERKKNIEYTDYEEVQ